MSSTLSHVIRSADVNNDTAIGCRWGDGVHVGFGRAGGAEEGGAGFGLLDRGGDAARPEAGGAGDDFEERRAVLARNQQHSGTHSGSPPKPTEIANCKV